MRWQLTGRGPALLPALVASGALGALLVLAFAPFRLDWLAPLILIAWFALIARSETPRHAVVLGFSFGLGLHLAGVSWIYISLHHVGGMPAPIALIALFGFCAYLALYYALFAWAVRRFATHHVGVWIAGVTALWTLAEWGKATVMTGFPWLTVGNGQVDSPVFAGYAPLIGAYGVSAAVALVAASMVAAWLVRPFRWVGVAITAVLVVGGLATTHIEWVEPSGQPVQVALLQGNVEQVLKWRDGEREKALVNYLELAEQNPADLVVLPETALPMTFERLPIDYLARLSRPARDRGGATIVGVVTRRFHNNAFDYFNTAVSLSDGAPQQYSKSHLVAFGEFIPPAFGWAYRWLNIPMANFSRESVPATPMQFAWGKAAVNICYEDAFGDEIIRQLPSANVLINLTNVAWFGRSIAADQHAQFSQMRSLETGRPSLRATNTGVTAVIDHRGRIAQSLPQFTRGALRVEFTPMRGTTPYVRTGDTPILMAMALALLVVGWASWRRNRGVNAR
jgi:apolipoprotein N-acyltransferase